MSVDDMFEAVAVDIELQNDLDMSLVSIVCLQQCTLKHIQSGLFQAFVVANKPRECRSFVTQLGAPPD